MAVISVSPMAGAVDAGENYDLVIINARIVDGTGNPWFRGSIAVKGWKDRKSRPVCERRNETRDRR